MKKIDIVENMINDHFQNDATNLYHFERLHFQTIENEIDAMDYDFFDKNIVQYMAAKFEQFEKTNKKIGYNAILELYKKFIEQGYTVKSFDSDKITILFDMITSNEILAISKTLKVSGFNNEIVMMTSISFKIRFI